MWNVKNNTNGFTCQQKQRKKTSGYQRIEERAE